MSIDETLIALDQGLAVGLPGQSQWYWKAIKNALNETVICTFYWSGEIQPGIDSRYLFRSDWEIKPV